MRREGYVSRTCPLRFSRGPRRFRPRIERCGDGRPYTRSRPNGGGGSTSTADGQTPETHLLNRHPGARELVEGLPEFLDWSRTLHVVDVDGCTYYVARGDQLMTRDEIIVEWGRLHLPNFLED
jgi:hypothetical protein